MGHTAKNLGLTQYLEKYSETEIRQIGFRAPGKKWDEVVVIPCYGENETVDGTLASLAHAAGFGKQRRVLAIVLVNGDNANGVYGEQNRALIARLRARPHDEGRIARSFWLEFVGKSLEILVVDRTFDSFALATSHSEIPEQGVGWARKFGCDLATRWIDEGAVVSEWIHTTDADARVDEDYFDLVASAKYGLGKNVGVFVHPFQHDGSDQVDSPIGLYDRWLRYYETGLRYAGSPYAFPTIGSLLSISAKTYVEVRGFPKKREAAEDFYLLSKAAKVAKVAIGGGKVTLTDRPSARVPFGTGVGVAKISDRLEGGGEFTLYHPESFRWLKKALDTAPDSKPEDFPEDIRRCLEKSDYFEAITEAGLRKTASDRRRTFHSHWDAFKTLKFIHALRDSVMPEVPWKAAMGGLVVLNFQKASPDPALQ